MEQLYALVNPVTNKIVQFSEFKNESFNIVDIEFNNGNRIITEHTALCVLVNYTPDLRDKTYNPETETFI